MTENVGGIDRVLRLLVGSLLLIWVFAGGPLWAWLGVLPLTSGMLGWCAFYPMLGINTSPKEPA